MVPKPWPLETSSILPCHETRLTQTEAAKKEKKHLCGKAGLTLYLYLIGYFFSTRHGKARAALRSDSPLPTPTRPKHDAHSRLPSTSLSKHLHRKFLLPSLLLLLLLLTFTSSQEHFWCAKQLSSSRCAASSPTDARLSTYAAPPELKILWSLPLGRNRLPRYIGFLPPLLRPPAAASISDESKYWCVSYFVARWGCVLRLVLADRLAVHKSITMLLFA